MSEMNKNFTLYKDINIKNLSAGIIAGGLAVLSIPPLVIEIANNGGLSTQQLILWMFSINFFGGLFGVLFSLYYKVPITGAHTLSGIAFIVTVAHQFSYSQLIGAFLLSGLIIFLVGISNFFTKIIQMLPNEIISATLAGLITGYVMEIASATIDVPLVGLVTFFVFIIFTKWVHRIPAVLAAIFFGLIFYLVTQDHTTTFQADFIIPTIQKPEFSVVAFIAVSIPLALLILGNDAVPGIGALKTNRYDIKTNKIIIGSGITTIVASLFGGQSGNVAGVMSVINADKEAGERKKRYVASVVSGIIIIIFGIFAWKIMPFIISLPDQIISLFTGFALIGVLITCLQSAFGSGNNNKQGLAPLFTFLISYSGISFYYISAPVWAMFIGTAIFKFINKKNN